MSDSGVWMQVYTQGGRRMLPAMQLERPAAFLANDTGWLLMAVASSGAMRVWDLQKQQLRLEGSIEALLHGAAGDARGGRMMQSKVTGDLDCWCQFKACAADAPMALILPVLWLTDFHIQPTGASSIVWLLC